ncbi:hypothetical protein ACWD7C_40680 [Streptomyces sp. NPDC005134]
MQVLALLAALPGIGKVRAQKTLTELDISESRRVRGLAPSVRGELLVRLGQTIEARAELELAARLCRNARERTVLLHKAAALE